MKKDVSIRLLSTQSDGNASEETELMSLGTLEMTDKGYIISYEETEATGFEGSTTSLEFFNSNKVVMNRRGSVVSNLVIEMGTKHHCSYGTPYGEFMVGINATRVDSTIGSSGGVLSFHYVVDVNSSYVGDFDVSVEIKPSGIVS
ncbi:MAG: DUF1934 domain-containing protein [Ruminococcus sp.]|nr:DUF1934 domain-containing protein [Ruminococcus sp.]